jgi:hypothetical protein
MYLCIHQYVCMYVCMYYVCVYVHTYVCIMYVYMHICVYNRTRRYKGPYYAYASYSMHTEIIMLCNKLPNSDIADETTQKYELSEIPKTKKQKKKKQEIRIRIIVIKIYILISCVLF